jgi:hypothetical protein
MPETMLSLHTLNRATLARQFLLERADLSVSVGLERLVGMQAQALPAPFIGLWTRLRSFQRDDLAQLIADRTIIKATTMRATLHLMTAADYARFRSTLQPALSKMAEGIGKQRGTDFDTQKVLDAARAFFAEKPGTFAELSDMLATLLPDTDVGAMRYTVRTYLPLVQVHVSGGWSYPGNPSFALADSWISQPIDTEDHIRELIFHYLAAFGPASVTDMQTWSGIPKLKAVFEKLKPELRVYRDENKRELFDLPDLTLPDAETPAPVRFLPEFDNLLLSHDKRTRVIADAHWKNVYRSANLRLLATFLVDGFVSGIWKIEKTKGTATLTLEPFAPLSPQARAALSEEGERLARFIEPDAKGYAFKVVE